MLENFPFFDHDTKDRLIKIRNSFRYKSILYSIARIIPEKTDEQLAELCHDSCAKVYYDYRVKYNLPFEKIFIIPYSDISNNEKQF